MYGQYPNTSFFLSRNPNRTIRRPIDRSKSNRSNDDKYLSEKKNPVFPVMKLNLTKREKDIREAIVYRYGKSRLKEYVYGMDEKKSSRTKSMKSTSSSDMKEYRELKGKTFVNLKEYHAR